MYIHYLATGSFFYYTHGFLYVSTTCGYIIIKRRTETKRKNGINEDTTKNIEKRRAQGKISRMVLT
jgi:hypothetical protein